MTVCHGSLSLGVYQQGLPTQAIRERMNTGLTKSHTSSDWKTVNNSW